MIDDQIDASRVCQYCESVSSEDNEIITKHAGDESMDICEPCYEHMFV